MYTFNDEGIATRPTIGGITQPDEDQEEDDTLQGDPLGLCVGGCGGLFLGNLTGRSEDSEKDHIRETVKDVTYGVEDRLNERLQAAMHEQFERLEGIQKLLEGLPGDFPRQASDDH